MKIYSKYLSRGLILAGITTSLGCTTSTPTEKVSLTIEKEEVNEEELSNPSEALSLLSNTCYTCHNPQTNSHEEILAPPLAGIKQRYLRESPERTNFIELMTAFVIKPNEEASLMKGPVRRFGLMPMTALKEEQIRAIVTYIFDNELPEPAWFAEHEKEMHRTNTQ